MSLYGGIEFTEGTPTKLNSFPGVVGAPPVPPNETVTIGGAQLGFYRVPVASVPALAGARRNDDHEVLRDGRIRLTNDVDTAEWVLAGHTVAGVDVDSTMQRVQRDVAGALALRQQLAGMIAAMRTGHPADTVLLAPGTADLRTPGPDGVFEYLPGGRPFGATQITVQYEKLSTITRIAVLNASKFLPGKKVDTGDDAAVVADTMSLTQRARYAMGTFSFTSGQTLLRNLTNTAAPVVVGGATQLTQAQVGVIKLMVLNDALAAVMRRYDDDLGQTADKNVQRFFPKSERQFYVNAVAGNAVGGPALAALRLQLTGAANAMAQLEWDSCDPFSLIIEPTANEIAVAEGDPAGGAATIYSTVRRGIAGEGVQAADITAVKNAVLGANGAGLATWIVRAARAYTDASGTHADHVDGTGVGNVITSIDFTAVAGGRHGAVYEFREREVELSMERRDEVLATMRTLLQAAL